MLIGLAQLLFTVFTIFCLLFDYVHLYAVTKHRLRGFNKNAYPFVYILFWSMFGILGKTDNLILICSWPIAEKISPGRGYEAYRQFMGKQVTLIATFSYLCPICLNWLMTIHRVTVVSFPFNTWIFRDRNLSIYCILLTLMVLISMLIPYYSNCSLNFYGPSTSFISACAPDRHPITLFQNKYTILLPCSAMCVNFYLILFLRYSRRTKQQQQATGKSSSKASTSQRKRENSMLRQAAFIASYLSIYEITNLILRLYPKIIQSMPSDWFLCFAYTRIFSICSLTFFVYFVVTKSSRHLVLSTFGLSSLNGKFQVIQVTVISS